MRSEGEQSAAATGGREADGSTVLHRPARKPESLLLKLLREPGTSERMIRALNYTLAALLVSIAFTIAVGLGDVHTYVLLFLTVGLLASVNWCASRAADGLGHTSVLTPELRDPSHACRFITQFRKVQARKEAEAAAGRPAGADARKKRE